MNDATEKPMAALQSAARNPATQRRRYISPKRQQQIAETQERIIAAGAELVHQLPDWDWTNISARAVSERAGISERTVHRYFPNERYLRDAVILRMVREANVSLDDLTLDGFKDMTRIMFRYLTSFAAKPLTTPTMEPSLATMDKIRRDALRNAVAAATPDWSEFDRENAAAMLDIFWNPPPYERLIQVWGFDPERAVDLMTWMITLAKEAIQQGRRPEVTV